MQKTEAWKEWVTPLDIPEGKMGEIEIDHMVMPADKVLQTGNARTMIFGQGEPRDIAFPVQTRWHRLTQESHGTWMTDLPIEQAQHRNLLSGMSGRVLLGGLGLGYAATVLAQRPEITLVDTVEINGDIIALVAPYLSDDVANKRDGKVYIHHCDLFEFLKGYQGEGWDWAYFDIWQSDSERTLHKVVNPLRELIDPFVPTQREVRCWNEDVMRGQLIQGIFSRMSQLKLGERGSIPQGITTYTLEQFATEQEDDIWWNWCVPFFQYALKVGLEKAMTSVDVYCQLFGLPEWEKTWTGLSGITPKEQKG